MLDSVVASMIADRRRRCYALQAGSCYFFHVLKARQRQRTSALAGTPLVPAMVLQEGARRKPWRNRCARLPCRYRAWTENGTPCVPSSTLRMCAFHFLVPLVAEHGGCILSFRWPFTARVTVFNLIATKLTNRECLELKYWQLASVNQEHVVVVHDRVP